MFLNAQALLGQQPLSLPGRPGDAIPIIVDDDGYSYFATGRYADKAALVRELRAGYGNGDVAILDWGLGPGGVCTFGTRVGERLGSGTPLPRSTSNKAVGILNAMLARGDDPLRIVIDTCHDLKMKLFISYRMNSFYYPPDDAFNGTWFTQRPQFRVQDAIGHLLLNYSYAYPEVTNHRLAIIREALGYGPDGLNLDFNRHPEFFGYEPILRVPFQRIYGIDPRTLGQDDPRWFACRAAIMTGFIRQCREALDAWGPGKLLSVRVDAENYHRFGLDLGTWVKEGLVDILIVTLDQLGGFRIDLDPFLAMCRGTRCKVYFGEEHITTGCDTTAEEEQSMNDGTLPRTRRGSISAAEHAQRALEWVAAGADGVHLFNAPLLPAIYDAIHNAPSRLKEP